MQHGSRRGIHAAVLKRSSGKIRQGRRGGTGRKIPTPPYHPAGPRNKIDRTFHQSLQRCEQDAQHFSPALLFALDSLPGGGHSVFCGQGTRARLFCAMSRTRGGKTRPDKNVQRKRGLISKTGKNLRAILIHTRLTCHAGGRAAYQPFNRSVKRTADGCVMALFNRKTKTHQ